MSSLVCLFVCFVETLESQEISIRMPFPITPWSLHQCQLPCNFDFDLYAERAFSDFVAAGFSVFRKKHLGFSPVNLGSIVLSFYFFRTIRLEQLGTTFSVLLGWLELQNES